MSRPRFDDPVVEGIASAFDPRVRVYVELPYSEVCVHMQVAGTMMWVEDVGNGMAQLYDDNWQKFSFPITWGEAGVYHTFKDMGR